MAGGSGWRACALRACGSLWLASGAVGGFSVQRGPTSAGDLDACGRLAFR